MKSAECEAVFYPASTYVWCKEYRADSDDTRFLFRAQ